MSVIRGREEEPAGKPSISSVEDLEVFRRAYAVSLEVLLGPRIHRSENV